MQNKRKGRKEQPKLITTRIDRIEGLTVAENN